MKHGYSKYVDKNINSKAGAAFWAKVAGAASWAGTLKIRAADPLNPTKQEEEYAKSTLNHLLIAAHHSRSNALNPACSK